MNSREKGEAGKRDVERAKGRQTNRQAGIPTGKQRYIASLRKKKDMLITSNEQFRGEAL